jgi:HEAT repeat protein
MATSGEQCYFAVTSTSSLVALAESLKAISQEVSVLNMPGIIVIVRWLAATIVCIDLTLVAFILYRRAVRDRFYRQQDAVRNRFAAIVSAYLAGTLPLERVAVSLKNGGPPAREAIKKLLLGSLNGRTRSAATNLLDALGFVQEWLEQEFGKQRAQQLLQFVHKRGYPDAVQGSGRTTWRRIRRLRLFSVPRAVAIGRLGRLSPEFSSVFVREALHDPSPYVTRTAIASIGRNQISEGVSVLLEELRKAVNGETELPIRSIKTALVRYAASDLRFFVGFMDNPNPRFRFLVVDTIREICRKAQDISPMPVDFPPELRSWFLEKAVRDHSADVRARSAAVASYFRDHHAREVLRLLLQDESEFVRLHSVRACADPHYADMIGDILLRTTDEKWRVREAAVKTLASFSSMGWQHLETLLINTSDRYASEQIIDELERRGLARKIVSELASGEEGHRTSEICSKMVRVGMVSSLTELLSSNQPLRVRTRLFEVLSQSEAPQFVYVLQRIADSEADPLRSMAESLLRERHGKAAAAAGKQG